MIHSILWPLALCCHIASIFTLRRIIKEIWRSLSTLEKDVRRCKIDTHHAVNESANNRLNILANHAECKVNWKKIETVKLGLTEDCKSLHHEAIEMYNGRLNYATREWGKKFEECEESLEKLHVILHSRDEAIAQRFSDVYVYIENCKKDRIFMQEALETLERPKKKKGQP